MMHQAPFLLTPRLMIVRFTLDMARRTQELSVEPDMYRFLPDEVFETEAEAASAITALMAAEASGHGPQVYPVLLRNGTQIGYVEAAPMEAGWEVGYHIGQAYTGQGYAAEAVRAFVPAIMARLGIKELHGVCLAENIASRRVLEKCGADFVGQGMDVYQGQAAEVCRYLFR